MFLDLSQVEYSNMDKKRSVKIPGLLDSKLAHLLGIHLGDGNLTLDRGRDYKINYSGHLEDESGWYNDYLIPLVEGIFNLKPYIQRDVREGNSCIRIHYNSKAIATFMVNVIGFPSGKKNHCGIPLVIKQADIDLKKAFLRGFVDTDFSIAFSKRSPDGLHKYPTLSLGTSNTRLAREISELFQELNLFPCTYYNLLRRRRDKTHKTNSIELNGKENLQRFMKTIGFSSPKHITKYEVWKKFGFCPPYTRLYERRAILAGEMEPLSFDKKLINH
jgi:hypothetical protein